MKNLNRSMCISVFFSMAFVMAACGSGSEEAPVETPAPTATIADVCLTSCTRRNACNPAVDAQICTNQCSNEGAGQEGRLRPDLLYKQNECVKAAGCATVLAPNYLFNCLVGATATIGASDEVVEACKALESGLVVRCAFNNFSLASCIQSMKAFTSKGLEANRQCADVPCGEVDLCSGRAAGLRDPAP